MKLAISQLRPRRDAMRATSPEARATSRRPTAALLLALFALLLQSLLPAAALAAQAGGRKGDTIVICTQMGVQTIRTDGGKPPAKGFAGLPCQDCLGPATAVTAAPQAPAVEPVVYAYVHVERRPDSVTLPVGARAPPRPPGQGPPTL